METNNENTIVTFVSTHPGEVLGDWLEDIGIKQKEFAATIGVPASRLNELVKGHRPMTEDMAQRLERHLGMDASYWMRLQAGFEYNEKMLALRNEEQKTRDAQEETLKVSFNLRELYRYLGITAVSSIERTKKLFSMLSATYESMIGSTAVVGCFRHSDTLRIDERNMRTWVLIARYEASKKSVSGTYSVDGANTSSRMIAKEANDGTLTERRIETILNQHGIVYAVVPKLDGCPIDAYSAMIGGRPAIIVTHRHDNMQKLVFDVLHEIGHITKHIAGEYGGFINTEYSQENIQETEANTFAMDALIPPDIWKKIIGHSVSMAREDVICREIGKRAKDFDIDPHIAVARYRHDSKRYKGRIYAHTRIV